MTRYWPLDRHMFLVHCVMQGGHRAHSADGGSFEAPDLKKGNGSLAGAKAMPLRVFARRCGAYVALAALAVQLVLSFGHINKHDFAFANGIASVGHARSQRQTAERHPSPLAADDEHCPICFSSFMLANSSLPDAPAKPPLPEWGSLDRASNSVSEMIVQPRRAAPAFSTSCTRTS